MFAAWHSALYARQKKLPELSKIMRRFDEKTPVKPQSPAALLAKMRAINIALGGRDLTRGGHG